ncbi:hypothetical protein GTY87_17095 [Streptomyces sp. SID7813]|uniref:Hypothetical proline-rich protein n=1 Tax=Streptomyces coelicolor (strain ATCC BAA-471 / A3(2) / M145) TaxID=100226 RepID=Q9X8L8_STRCO|nr:hypothetical protein [Streptomyces sp. SID7813]QFI43411.1 hypothetical protein FQ762_17245 [Streptomyces coelicolor A3(2)]THA88464.1 hypothetical protein E6R61_25760 [Streptomyces sp. LRa12]CAB40854.1 hypothetical proline-rich protein [Streptomyces coelicolor A3(2)]
MQLGRLDPAGSASSAPTPVTAPPPPPPALPDPADPPPDSPPPDPEPFPALPPPEPDPEPEPLESPLPDSSRPPGAWLIAGPDPEGPGVIDGAGFLPLAPSSRPLPPSPPPETTIHVINSANRAKRDSSTALRRQ